MSSATKGVINFLPIGNTNVVTSVTQSNDVGGGTVNERKSEDRAKDLENQLRCDEKFVDDDVHVKVSVDQLICGERLNDGDDRQKCKLPDHKLSI